MGLSVSRPESAHPFPRVIPLRSTRVGVCVRTEGPSRGQGEALRSPYVHGHSLRVASLPDSLVHRYEQNY